MKNQRIDTGAGLFFREWMHKDEKEGTFHGRVTVVEGLFIFGGIHGKERAGIIGAGGKE